MRLPSIDVHVHEPLVVNNMGTSSVAEASCSSIPACPRSSTHDPQHDPLRAWPPHVAHARRVWRCRATDRPHQHPAGCQPVRQSCAKIGAQDTILTIRAEGGHCVSGACWSEQQVKADGSFTATDSTGAQKKGTVDAAHVAELTQQIAATDFAQLKAQPFTGICPLAFDGQELIYTFHTVSGPQTIASCTVGIDENSPLFQNIAALNEVMNQD